MTERLKVFLIVFILSLPFWWGANLLEKDLKDLFFWQITSTDPQLLTAQINQQRIQDKIESLRPVRDQYIEDLELKAESVISILFDSQNNQKILFKKELDKILPIASLTKLMTAVIVLDNSEIYDFSQIVTVSKTAVAQDENFGNLKIGDELSVKNLLYIMLIESSNDAAYALSEVMGVEKFIEEMNKKAGTLNLKTTYFINPTGLDATLNDPKNTSTAEDLAKLSQYILEKYPIIFEISSLNSYEVLDSENQPHHLAITSFARTNGSIDINKNKLLELASDNIIVGGKTGYTDLAKGCLILVTEAPTPKQNEFATEQENQKYLINVILGSEDRFGEMRNLVDWLNKAYKW